MEQLTVNSVLIGVLTLIVLPLIVYVFLNSNKVLTKEIDELKRKQELTDAHLREFENVKFQEIMTALSGLITDVAVIKSEIGNLQKQNNTTNNLNK